MRKIWACLLRFTIFVAFFSLSSAVLFPREHRVVSPVAGMKTLSNENFDIIFPEGSEEIALFTLKYAQEGYLRISEMLDHKMGRVIPIIVYPSEISFQQNNILRMRIPESLGGFTDLSKVRVVLPFSGDHALFRHVLIHEIVHAFQFDILHDHSWPMLAFSEIPLWYMEGMAEYFSIGYDYSADLFMRDIIINGRFVGLRSFNKGSVYTGYQYYKQGQSFCRFVDDVYGSHYFKKIMLDALRLRDFDKALEENFDKSLFELSNEWERYYKRKYFTIIEGRDFDDEIGVKLLDHVKEPQSNFSMPSISPDGKKIAYVRSSQGEYQLCVSEIQDDKISNTEVIDGGYSTNFQALNFFYNSISWSQDSSLLIYGAQAKERKVIRIYDFQKEDFRSDIVLPFLGIRDPYFHSKSNSIIFVARRNVSYDLYQYMLDDGALNRLTNDNHLEHSPVINSEGTKLYYISNICTKKTSTSNNGNIFEKDLLTGETVQLTVTDSRKRNLRLSHDEKYLLYSDNYTGISNLYKYDFLIDSSVRVTNVINGVHSPVMPSEGKIVFAAYSHFDYHIVSKDYDGTQYFDDESFDFLHLHDEVVPSSEKKAITDGYDSRLYRDYFFFLAGGAVGQGAAVASAGLFSDLLGNHRLNYFAELQYGDEFEKNLNFELRYLYARPRTEFYLATFNRRNPHGLFSFHSLNEHLGTEYSFTPFYVQYGANSGLIYPFTRFTALNYDLSVFQYETYGKYIDPNNTLEEKFAEGVFLKNTLELTHRNYSLGIFGPAEGLFGYIRASLFHSSDSLKDNFAGFETGFFNYYSLDNFFSNKIIFNAGTFLGDNGSVKYALGGSDFFRAVSHGDVTGDNFISTVFETNFVLIRSLVFGFSDEFSISNTGFAFFTDTGAVWDEKFEFVNDDGLFEDYILHFGCGLRFSLGVAGYFKLDLAYPYDGNDIGNSRVQFSLTIN